MYHLTTLAFLFLFSSPSQTQSALPLHVPPGFRVERVAVEPDVVYPMFAAFDDQGRLYVAESSGLDLYAELKAQTRRCRIRVLEDADDHGRFRKSRVFADQLVFPMGLVWQNGKLYVADPPDLITLEDRDGDGKAETRTVILTGFGHLDNGSLHGLTFGPDGWLYMTMGQPDGYRLKRRDGTILQGTTGALIRCRPDGSDPEVLCRGFENLVEVVFTPRGDIIGTDNWFQRPSGGMRDALVHLVAGGLYPLHANRDKPVPITGEYLPPISLFPAVALSGLARYRGQAFTAMRGHLFCAQHNARKVSRHLLIPHGATFRTQDLDFLTSDSPDFHPSDVLEDADGSLLVIDTGSWYVHHCPTGKIRQVKATGGIYRVRREGAKKLADPRGLKIDWAGASLEQLVFLLGDHRPVVRDRAQRTLSGGGLPAVTPLAELLLNGKNLNARQHALWALAGINGEQATAVLRQALADPQADILMPAAWALAARGDKGCAKRLLQLLSHKEWPIRLAAAQALSRCGQEESPSALWQALTLEVDPFLEHALVHAAFYMTGVAELEKTLDHPHPRVQKAALILLNQVGLPTSPARRDQVLARLRSADSDLRQTAVRVLRNHPEWADDALGLLHGWLGKKQPTAEEERSLRELILAFQNRKQVQDLLARVLVNPQEKVAGKPTMLVLETMADSSLGKVPPAWAEALGKRIQTSADEKVRFQAVRTAAVLQVPELDGILVKVVDNPRRPQQERLEALRAVVLRQPRLSPPGFALVLTGLAEQDQPLVRLKAAEIVGRAHLPEGQLKEIVAAVRDDALLSPTMLLPALLRAKEPATAAIIMKYLTEANTRGWQPSPGELDQLTRAFALLAGGQVQELAKRAAQAAERREKLVKELAPLLHGGDPGRGRAVFFSKKATCAVCHRIGSEGGTVGPDLTKIGAGRSGRDLLEAIVAPSSTLAQGYEPYLFATADGKVLNGLLVRQTADAVVVRDGSGSDWHLRKERIQDMRRSPTSPMPEGLDRLFTSQEFRDLLTFLQNLK